MGAPIGGRIVGNLDCEASFAGRPGVRPRVEKAISALGTLLRAFAAGDDVLWVPHLVCFERMAEVPGLPQPCLESGHLEGMPPAGRVLAWGETAAVERERSRAGPARPPEARDRKMGPLARALWDITPPPVAAAAAANHRGFALEAARELGADLPGATLLGGVTELEAHLARGGAAAAPEERWVLKAPYSAAGRERLRGAGRTLRDPERRRALYLFAVHGALLFEPWMERTADFGILGLIDDHDFRLLGTHRLLVTPGGGFRGIDVPAAGAAAPGLTPGEAERLEAVARAVAARLRAAGYRGPFGIDCWRYRDAGGVTRFHPLGEVNARLTFGFVARALAERLRGAAGEGGSPAVRLAVGPRLELASHEAAGAAVIPLLLPTPRDDTAAWVELTPPPPGGA